jgi:tetratricopeptide (TPR) repeat protein
VVRAAESANAIGEVLLNLDRCAQARQRFTEALRMWRGARAPEGVALATRNLGVIALREGDADEACRRLEEAAELAETNRLDGLRVAISLPLARALLRLGRFVEAWDTATRVLDETANLSATDAAQAHELRAEALRATGGTRRAEIELERARGLAPATRGEFRP